MPKIFLYVIVASLLSAGFVVAQDDDPVQISLEAFLVEVVSLDDGSTEERFEPAEVANPGQVIEYRTHVENIGDARLPAATLVITVPVPAATAFVDASATAASDSLRLEFSADGSETFSAPPVLITIINADGEEEVVEASPDQYTHVRWIVLDPVPSGGIFDFSFRAQVR
jgi:uncharacterized repeat protein (TIGR01451 family)